MKPTWHVFAASAALIAAGLAADSWIAARRASLQLAAALASQNALLAQASDREHQRDAQLASALSQIAAEKRRIQTPQQAAEALASVLPPLPLPISVRLPDLTAAPTPSEPAPASVSIPQADLKPLFDAFADCSACALERESLKMDLADEQAKTTALIRERDAAIAAARGGAFWSRLRRGAKWFAIGVALGAAAASASHH
jgi:phage tail protein X